MHGYLCAIWKGEQVFNTEQYHFGRPFTMIRRKYTMNRIFFANPFPGLRPSYGFPAVNRFQFFHLPLLAYPAVAAVPSVSRELSFHNSLLFSLDPGWKAPLSRSKWQIHQWEIFSTMMLRVLSTLSPSRILRSLVWSSATPRHHHIVVPNALGMFTFLLFLHYSCLFFCSFDPQMYPISGSTTRARAWQWRSSSWGLCSGPFSSKPT